MSMLGIGRNSLILVNNGVRRSINDETVSAVMTRRSITKSSSSLSSQLTSPELVALEYADLNLDTNAIDINQVGGPGPGHVRIRQHVNPLSSSFTVPAPVPDWTRVFSDSALPLMVDIGCGSGRFLIWQAHKFPQTRNFLGLEIRQKLVKRAQLWVEQLTLNNICFLFANATVSFQQLVSTYPGPLVFVSVLCPDPHFKKKHHKRRVVQMPLVNSIINTLAPHGQVFVQSDVLEVAEDMRFQLDSHLDKLEHIDTVDPSFNCDDQGWLLKNPMGVRTEREIHAESEGGRIYRRMYQKREILLLQHY